MSKLRWDEHGWYYVKKAIVVFGYNSFGPCMYEVANVKVALQCIEEEEYESCYARLAWKETLIKKYIPTKKLLKRYKEKEEEPVVTGYFEYWDGTREFLKGTEKEFQQLAKQVGPGDKLVYRTPGTTKEINTVATITLAEYLSWYNLDNMEF